MKQLLQYTSKSTIKPELAHIYVHKGEVYGSDDQNLYAVATDSFRLLEIKITDPYLLEYAPTGYYTQKEWQTLSTLIGKKKRDIQDIQTLLNNIKAHQDNYKGYNYPQYKQIIPTTDKLDNITSLVDIKVNGDYFIDFIASIPQDKFFGVQLNDIKIKKDKRMITFIKDNTKALVMLMN